MRKAFVDGQKHVHHMVSDQGAIWDRCEEHSNALGDALAGIPVARTSCDTGLGWQFDSMTVRVGWPTWMADITPHEVVRLEVTPPRVLIDLFELRDEMPAYVTEDFLYCRRRTPAAVVRYIQKHHHEMADWVRLQLRQSYRSILPYVYKLGKYQQQMVLSNIDLSTVPDGDFAQLLSRGGVWPPAGVPKPKGGWMERKILQGSLMANKTLPRNVIDRYWEDIDDHGVVVGVLGHVNTSTDLLDKVVGEALASNDGGTQSLRASVLKAMINNPNIGFWAPTRICNDPRKSIAEVARGVLLRRQEELALQTNGDAMDLAEGAIGK